MIRIVAHDPNQINGQTLARIKDSLLQSKISVFQNLLIYVSNHGSAQIVSLSQTEGIPLQKYDATYNSTPDDMDLMKKIGNVPTSKLEKDDIKFSVPSEPARKLFASVYHLLESSKIQNNKQSFKFRVVNVSEEQSIVDRKRKVNPIRTRHYDDVIIHNTDRDEKEEYFKRSIQQMKEEF